jgi:hypothetical protein
MSGAGKTRWKSRELRIRDQALALAGRWLTTERTDLCSLNADPLISERGPLSRIERTGNAMTHTTVLITDMAILVGIFLLGFLAKIFPKRGRNGDSKN